MSHRTQITLTDEQYERLQQTSRETGLGLAELVRRALDQTYGSHTVAERGRALERSFGAWSDRDIDGATYVQAIRRGLGKRLAG